MRLLQKTLLATALMLTVGASLHAQESDSDRRAHARERWDAMTPTEQAIYRERFERLRGLPPEERRALVERAADLERRKRELFGELPQESKRRLDALPQERRELILREYFDACERVRGLRLREQLPPEFLERLESVPPEERRVLMREFHLEMKERAGERMLGTMRREMALSPEKLSELSKLPENDRRRAMLELKRESIRERIQLHGLPPGVSTEEWKELDALPFDEFFMRWGHRREGRFGEERRPGVRRPEGSRDIREGGGTRGPGGMRPERRGDRQDRFGPSQGPGIRGRLIDELFRLSHPDLNDLLENADVPPEQRRAVVTDLIRARCLKYLDANPVLKPEELERLRALPPHEFVREIRSLLGEARGDRWSRSESDRPPRPHR